jgi:hypothetical protein
MVDERYYIQLAQFFSRPVCKEIARGGGLSKFMSYVLTQSGYAGLLEDSVTLAGLFESLYDFLKRNYRCEYVYKNALANKILLGRHSLATSTLLTELRVENSKADVVILNGTSCVYEIKTELDSLDRLEGQLRSYRKVFDKIYVVTHESQLGKLRRVLRDDVGILVLTERYRFHEAREALSNKSNVDAASIFDCLRQSEYRDIIEREYGFVPDVPNTRIYAECKKLFARLDPVMAHEDMVDALKSRSPNRALATLVDAVPHSLKLLSVVTDLTARQRASFVSALSTEVMLS